MFGYNGLLRCSFVCTNFEQTLGDHQPAIVRLELGLEAVCEALAGASRGVRLLEAQTGWSSWRARRLSQKHWTGRLGVGRTMYLRNVCVRQRIKEKVLTAVIDCHATF